jgi:hypothetical protein
MEINREGWGVVKDEEWSKVFALFIQRARLVVNMKSGRCVMHRNHVFLLVISLLVAGLLFILSTGYANAAPVPPLRVVNHETKECGEIFGGDECMDCFPPEGWEILGWAMDEPCPEGYTDIGSVGYECEAFKAEFCCTEGHSGAHGDCEDMVINRRNKQCTFVPDIATADLPSGWRAKPNRTADYEWACPNNYEWVDDLETSGGGESGFNLPCCSSAFVLGPAVLVVVLGRKNKLIKSDGR